MAYQFDRGSDNNQEHIAVSWPTCTTGEILSVAMKVQWFSTPGTGTSNRQALFNKTNTSYFGYYGFATGNIISLGWYNSTYRELQASWTADTNLHTIVWVWDFTDTNAYTEVFLDGVSIATDNSIAVGTVADYTNLQRIGMGGIFGAAGGINAYISEVAAWKGRRITEAEAKALTKGNPLSINRTGLVRYWPLVRDVNEIVGKTTATLGGPSNPQPWPHPPVIKVN